MTYGAICDMVECIRRKYNEPDPFRLINEMGMVLDYQALGKGADSIKGFFMESHRIKLIMINSDLPEVIQRIIAAHEIGHAVLHSKSGIHAFHDVGLFDESNVCEKEANLFAAEYLLDDTSVFSMLNADNTFFSAAATLKVPMELLDFKFRLMKWRGFKLEPPIHSSSDFMKKMEVPKNADYFG